MAASSPERFTIAQLAQEVGGEVRGDDRVEITGINTLTDASASQITFITRQAYATMWLQSSAAAALVTRGIERSLPSDTRKQRPLIIVPDAEHAMLRILELFRWDESVPELGVHATAVIDPSARMGRNVRIGPFVSIGLRCVIGDGVILHAGVRLYADVHVGNESILHANVVVRDRCVLGQNVLLHQGVAIGADGFGYRPAPGGSCLLKMPHVGNVIIEDDVEIGANSCVDRGKFGSTVIGQGTKIDNLCQIAHNCRIGRHCVLAGQAALAGSVVLGDSVQIGGQAGIAEQLKIGHGAKIGAKSGVMRDVPDGGVVMGIPAEDARNVLRQTAAIRKLPDLLRQMSQQEREAMDDR